MIFKYCKKLKDNGLCTKLKPWTEGRDDNDDIFYVNRKCTYSINDLFLVPTKNRKYKSYKLSNGCPFFEPVNGLEKMLEVIGKPVFSKKDFLLFEDDDNYYIVRDVGDVL